MKSLLPIDETWTVNTFCRALTAATPILTYNKLPDTSKTNANPFSTLLEQQKNVIQTVAGGVKYAHDTIETTADLAVKQLTDIKSNLSDDIKAVAIASMDQNQYSDYKVTGFLSGFLNIPSMIIDTVTPIVKGVQTQILNLTTESTDPEELIGSLSTAQDILRNQIPVVEIPATTTSNKNYTDNWYWKPRGEVMIQIEGAEPMEIPAWPEDISDHIAVSWSQEMTTFQHYEDQNTFKQSGPRTMTLLFKLHRAMWNGNQDSGDCEALIAYIESACYPDYDTQAAEPPRVLFTAGKSIRIYGIITNMNVKYYGPIGPDVKYDCVDISIDIKEESQNVLSTQAVRSGLAGWR